MTKNLWDKIGTRIMGAIREMQANYILQKKNTQEKEIKTLRIYHKIRNYIPY